MDRKSLKIKAALAGTPGIHWWPELAPLTRHERNEVLAALNPTIEEGKCLCGGEHRHGKASDHK